MILSRRRCRYDDATDDDTIERASKLKTIDDVTAAAWVGPEDGKFDDRIAVAMPKPMKRALRTAARRDGMKLSRWIRKVLLDAIRKQTEGTDNDE